MLLLSGARLANTRMLVMTVHGAHLALYSGSSSAKGLAGEATYGRKEPVTTVTKRVI